MCVGLQGIFSCCHFLGRKVIFLEPLGLLRSARVQPRDPVVRAARNTPNLISCSRGCHQSEDTRPCSQRPSYTNTRLIKMEVRIYLEDPAVWAASPQPRLRRSSDVGAGARVKAGRRRGGTTAGRSLRQSPECGPDPTWRESEQTLLR